MLLTNNERAFLAVFIHEATTDPFKGPVTDELHRRDIYYTDLSDLMEAYYVETSADQEPAAGEQNLQTPFCPWSDRDAVVRRNQEVRLDLETTDKQTTS